MRRGFERTGSWTTCFLLAACASAPEPRNGEGDWLETFEVRTITPDPSRIGGLLQGKPVEGASCLLWNSLGSWSVVTPGSVTVKRTFIALDVKCVKEGFAPSTMAVQCSQLDGKTSLEMAGAFLLGMGLAGLPMVAGAAAGTAGVAAGAAAQAGVMAADPPSALNKPIPCWYTRGSLVVRMLPE